MSQETMMKKFLSTAFILIAVPMMAKAPGMPTSAAETSQSIGGSGSGAPQPTATGLTLAKYMQFAKYDGITLSFVVVNAETAELLFPAPAFPPATKYAMRARSGLTTVLFVQGTPQKDLDFSTTFSITQDGETITSTPSNIRNFKAGPVPNGQRIDGVLIFSKKIDLTKPFKLQYEKGAEKELNFADTKGK